MKKDKLRCGCVVDVEKQHWLVLCAEHQAEYDRFHKAHADDMRARQEAKCLKP